MTSQKCRPSSKTQGPSFPFQETLSYSILLQTLSTPIYPYILPYLRLRLQKNSTDHRKSFSSITKPIKHSSSALIYNIIRIKSRTAQPRAGGSNERTASAIHSQPLRPYQICRRGKIKAVPPKRKTALHFTIAPLFTGGGRFQPFRDI